MTAEEQSAAYGQPFNAQELVDRIKKKHEDSSEPAARAAHEPSRRLVTAADGRAGPAGLRGAGHRRRAAAGADGPVRGVVLRHGHRGVFGVVGLPACRLQQLATWPFPPPSGCALLAGDGRGDRAVRADRAAHRRRTPRCRCTTPMADACMAGRMPGRDCCGWPSSRCSCCRRCTSCRNCRSCCATSPAHPAAPSPDFRRSGRR